MPGPLRPSAPLSLDRRCVRLRALGLACLVAVGLATPVGAQVAEQDSLALVTLYTATDGPRWTRSDNWLDGPVRTWFGVTLDGAGTRVVRLRLPANGLRGPVPAEIARLSKLQNLQVQTNALTGGIPPEIGQLAELEVLSLFLNQLSGSIPNEVGTLTALTSFGLGENDLSGTLPAELGQLANLEQFDVNGNRVGGALPPQLGQLKNLKGLVLRNNPFTGPVPLAFVELEALTRFEFDGTGLCEPRDDAFAAWIAGLTTVRRTAVACNQAPTAQGDVATTGQNRSVRIDVLANDADTDADDLTISAVSSPTHGTASVDAGEIVYTPDTDYVGADAFTYTIDDGNGGTATAAVSVDVTTVTANEAGETPAFAVEPPTPNPARGAVTIVYTLPRRTPVRLDVFDLAGHHVATLVDRELGPGHHRATLPDELASSLASGVYVFRLRAGRERATRAGDARGDAGALANGPSPARRRAVRLRAGDLDVT